MIILYDTSIFIIAAAVLDTFAAVNIHANVNFKKHAFFKIYSCMYFQRFMLFMCSLNLDSYNCTFLS